MTFKFPGTPTCLAAFDPTAPPSKPQAQALLAQIADILGGDPKNPDAGQLQNALSSLCEAAGLPPPEPATDDADDEDDGGEQAAVTDPRVVAHSNLTPRERAFLSHAVEAAKARRALNAMNRRKTT